MFFFFQAEDGIRDLVRSRGLGDVYKRQASMVLRKTSFLENSRWQAKVGRPCLTSSNFCSTASKGALRLSLIHI